MRVPRGRQSLPHALHARQPSGKEVHSNAVDANKLSITARDDPLCRHKEKDMRANKLFLRLISIIVMGASLISACAPAATQAPVEPAAPAAAATDAPAVAAPSGMDA